MHLWRVQTIVKGIVKIRAAVSLEHKRYLKQEKNNRRESQDTEKKTAGSNRNMFMSSK